MQVNADQTFKFTFRNNPDPVFTWHSLSRRVTWTEGPIRVGMTTIREYAVEYEPSTVNEHLRAGLWKVIPDA